MNYTWTGHTSGATNNAPTSKLAFNALKNIVSIFHDIIYLVDNSFSEKDNIMFLQQRILKYAKTRSIVENCARKSAARVVHKRYVKHITYNFSLIL